MVGIGNVDNTSDASKTFTQTQIINLTADLALKANLASPTCTGIVNGIVKAMVGLGNVDTW